MANDLIKKYEGLRLDAYKCPAGVWTIGYGTTIYPNGKKVRPGDKCTEQQADSYLAYHLENEINCHLDKEFSNLKTNQREALQSLLYNWSWLSFRKSLLYTAIKKNDIAQIFRQWDIIRVNGEPSLGLIRRRLEELTLWFR
jgi:lysozyme